MSFEEQGQALRELWQTTCFCVFLLCVSLTTHIAFPEQCIPRLFTASLPHIWLHIRHWPHPASYSATRFACITCAKGWNRGFRGLIALSRRRWTSIIRKGICTPSHSRGICYSNSNVQLCPLGDPLQSRFLTEMNCLALAEEGDLS